MFCVSETLWHHSDKHFLAPSSWTQIFRVLIMWAIWNFGKGTGLPWLDIRLWGTKCLYEGL